MKEIAEALVEVLGPKIFGYPTIEEFNERKLTPKHEKAALEYYKLHKTVKNGMDNDKWVGE